jgi:hypothetical protein
MKSLPATSPLVYAFSGGLGPSSLGPAGRGILRGLGGPELTSPVPPASINWEGGPE